MDYVRVGSMARFEAVVWVEMMVVTMERWKEGGLVEN